MAALMLLCAACTEEAADAPHLQIAGGGFIFNYRLASAEYGFVARVLRPLPHGAILEAEFEDPAGGPALRVRQATRPGRLEYLFRSPPLHGVRAEREYRVALRLLDGDDERVLASYRRTFRSDVDQDILPGAPTVVGPGHQPRGDEDEPAAPR